MLHTPLLGNGRNSAVKVPSLTFRRQDVRLTLAFMIVPVSSGL